MGCAEPVYDAGDGGDDMEPDARLPGAPDGSSSSEATVPTCEGPACTASCETPPCTDEPEAGAPEDAGPDVGPSPEAGLDPIRSSWVGRFATRSFLYSWDGLVEGSARFLTLAQIKPGPDGTLLLEEELCLWEGGWALFVTSQARIIFPGTTASSTLRFDAESFESMEAIAPIGYGASPSGCEAGAATIQAQPEQVWLTNNTCDCPRSTAVPSSARDCRVTDTDPDRKPGYTFNATLASSRFEFHVTQEERLRFLNGYRVGDRLFAERLFADTTHVIGCVIDGVAKRPTDCPLGGAAYCPSSHNKAEFAPILPNVGCREIIQREEGLFMKQRPPFPAACPSQVSL